MKIILLLPFYLFLSTSAYSSVDPEIHKICLEARDYAGCIKSLPSGLKKDVKIKQKKELTFFKRDVPVFDDFTKESRIVDVLKFNPDTVPDQNDKIQPCTKFLARKDKLYHKEICYLTYENSMKFRDQFFAVPLSKNVVNIEHVLLKSYNKNTDHLVGYEIKQVAVDCKLKKLLERRIDYKFAKDPDQRNSKFIRNKGYGKWEITEADDYMLSTSCPVNPGYSRANLGPNKVFEFDLENIQSKGDLKIIPYFYTKKNSRTSDKGFFTADCKNNSYALTTNLPTKEDDFDPISTYKHHLLSNRIYTLACIDGNNENYVGKIFSKFTKSNSTQNQKKSEEEKAYFESNSLVKEGKKMSANFKFSEAITFYTKAIEINPKNADAYVGRGLAKNFLLDRDGACSDFKKAVDLGDDDASVILNDFCR